MPRESLFVSAVSWEWGEDCVIWFTLGSYVRAPSKHPLPPSPTLFPLYDHTLFFSLGPLMPEHLDVQNIPVSKRRDLTVDLCGEMCRTDVL